MKFDYWHSTGAEAFGTGAGRASPAHALTEAIAATAEICGQPLSPVAVSMLAEDLGGFPAPAILVALARCRLELQGALRTADILARIDDGRPDAEQAWAMLPKDEFASVVWTDEMAQAWGGALPLLNAGDVATAQAVFHNAYGKAVVDARLRREPVHWSPSLGTDIGGRRRVLLDALHKGRLSAAHVEQLLPTAEVALVAEPAVAQIRSSNLH